MADDEHREFFGLVEGNRLPFKVTASVGDSVEDLKKLVGSLRGVDDTDLVLWKVSNFVIV